MHIPTFLVSFFAAAILAAPSIAQDAASAATDDPLQQARRLANTGRGNEALGVLGKLPESTPGVQDVRGLALYNLDRLQEADAAYAAALRNTPGDAEAAQMRGLTLYRLGRPAEAIPLLLQGENVEAQTKSTPTYVLALCYIDTRRYDDARAAFAAQFGFPPDSPAAYLLAGRMLLRREYLPVAQRFALEALRRDPHLPLAHELLGEIALAGNHNDEAIQHFEQERTTNPLQPGTYERLGDAYSRAGNYPAARHALQQAILLEPNSTGPYILLGKVTMKEGDAVAAMTYLQKAERMDPANYMTHNLLAQTYRTLGRTADATRELKLTSDTQSDAPQLAPIK